PHEGPRQLMLRLTRRSLWEHKRRLVSTVIAIVLGVAFVSGTFVMSDTLDKGFDDLFSTVNEKVDAQVQGEVLFSDPFMGDSRQLLDPELLETVREVDGVAGVEPFVTAVGFGSSNRVLDAEGDPLGSSQGPPTLFENWIEDEALSPYDMQKGRPPESDREFAINTAAAEDGELEVGDEVEILTQFGREVYTLVGTFNFGDAKSAGGAVTVDFTLAEAMRLTGTDGRYQQLFARGDDGLSEQELVDRITPVLPASAEAITGEEAAAQLSSDVQSGFSFFKTMLTVFGGLALLVGVFVISNTFSILVAQRTRELALLRAVGASRGQVLGSVIVEALLIGLFAALLGLVVGILLAQGVTSAFTGGDDFATGGLAITPATIIRALVIGMTVTLVAALVPAIRSMRVPPIAALRSVALDRSGTSKARLIGGVLVLAFGLLNLSAAWRGSADTDDLPPTGLGAVLVIVAAIVLGPVLAGISIRALGQPILRLRGITGQLATENAARSPKRTSATASAILIAVALIGFITIFASSAKASVTEEVSRGFTGDFVVQAEGGFFGPPSGFPTTVEDDVAAVDGVDQIVPFGFVRADFTYETGKTAGQFLSSVDPTKLDGVLDPRMVEGTMADLTDDGIVVDIGQADDHQVEIGQTIEITFPGGNRVPLTVQAISDDENLLGYLTITENVYRANVPGATDTFIMGSIDDGADSDTVLADIEDAIATVPNLEALDRDGFIGDLAEQLNQFVTIIYVLLGLSVIIAFVGIGNTISLSVHERTRELGLLRAVGMNRGQLRSSIRWEAILMSVLGALVGLALSLLLSRAIIEALSSAGLTVFRVPVGQLVIFTVAAALLGVVASLLPARRTAKLPVLEAIAQD
ncbi:MAG: ABC transporter permease, partial [Actinomycetota bacterium]|nr:ABC transporter permease [Actinomycetota bacterium]